MPLTSTERSKKHRASLTKNQVDAVKAKDCMRKVVKKNVMSMNEKRITNTKQKIVMRKWRKVQKNAAKNKKVESVTHGSYKTADSLKKAKQRARASFPKHPDKQKAVINSIASEFGLIPNPKQASNLNHALSNKVVELVIGFYEQSDVSVTQPGRADFISVRHPITNKKVKIQKKFLLQTVDKLFHKFKVENPLMKIERSKFFALRPRHCRPRRQTPENLCQCIHCENMQFRENALVPFFSEIRPLANFAMCNLTRMCMEGICVNCSNKLNNLIEGADEKDLSEKIVYPQWGKDDEGRVVLLNTETTVGDLLLLVQMEMSKFLFHLFVKEKQAKYFYMLRTGVSQSNGLLQIDFAENAVITQKNEVQLAHWRAPQVAIFTAVFWYLHDGTSEIKSFVIVSNYMSHDKYAVAVFLAILYEKIKTLAPNIDLLDIFSDNASQHFKQSGSLTLISNAPLHINWHNFACYHGKGVVDGLGGNIKRMVYDSVRAGEFVPRDAATYAECAKACTKEIEVIYVSDKDVLAEVANLNEFWKDVKSIPNIRKIHCVRVIDEKTLELSQVSTEKGVNFVFKKR